jgi:hypothetical protein
VVASVFLKWYVVHSPKQVRKVRYALLNIYIKGSVLFLIKMQSARVKWHLRDDQEGHNHDDMPEAPATKLQFRDYFQGFKATFSVSSR